MKKDQTQVPTKIIHGAYELLIGSTLNPTNTDCECPYLESPNNSLNSTSHKLLQYLDHYPQYSVLTMFLGLLFVSTRDRDRYTERTDYEVMTNSTFRPYPPSLDNL